MRRFFTASLLTLILATSAWGANVTIAHAQGGIDYTADGTVLPSATPSADSYTYTGPNNSTPLPSNPVSESGFNAVIQWIMKLFAWLVGVAALTLQYAVYYTVLTMGDYVKHLSAIGVTWRILRDIGNIILIFGFLAIGISTILNLDIYGWSSKMLPKLLLAAIFLNFSLFIAEAVIDTGNLFATQFYTQINGGALPQMTSGGLSVSGVLTSVDNEGISNKIMAQVGLQNIYGAVNTEVFKASGSWIVGFMGIILFTITAFVMFSLAFILIARFVILLFLIIVAPIGFAGWAMPKLEGLAKQWWGALFEQTATAPVLMLLLYIALAIITDSSFLTGFGMAPNGPQWAWLGFINNGNMTGFASTLLSFLVAMGLLLAVVITAKKMSAFGADWATGLGGKLSFGTAAFVGRRTVGRASNYAARKIRSSALGRTETGRLLAGVADRGAKGNFDLRSTGLIKNIPFVGVAAGEGQKGGYRAREEELIKVRTDYAKTLRQSEGQKKATQAAEDAKSAAEKTHADNMKPLEAEEQAQLKLTKEIIDASREELKLKKQELDAARKSGDENSIKTAEIAYNNDLQTHNDLKEAESAKLDPVRNKMQAEKARHDVAIAAQDKIIKDNSNATNQRKYGEVLQEKSFLGIPRAPYDWTTAVGSARREAADKIIGDSKKDKSQQQMDRLEAILAKADGKVEPSDGGKKP